MGGRELDHFVDRTVRDRLPSRGCYRRTIDRDLTLKKGNLHIEKLQFLFLFFAGGIGVSLGAVTFELCLAKICPSKGREANNKI